MTQKKSNRNHPVTTGLKSPCSSKHDVGTQPMQKRIMRLRKTITTTLLVMMLLLTAFSIHAQTPVAYYPLNANANDASGNALNGTITGTVTPVTDRFGNANSAMSFPGNTNSFIQIADNPLLRPTSITISCWVNVAAGGLNTFVHKALSPCVNDSWFVGTESGNFRSYVSNSFACGDQINISSPQINNTWKFVAFTVDVVSDTRSFYIDGVQVATGAYTSTLQYDGNPMTFGAGFENGTMSFPLLGSLDEVKIYNTALTAAQILAEYNPNTYSSQFNNSVKMNGINDYIQPPTILNGATQFTIEYWINTTENRTNGTFSQNPTMIGNEVPGASSGEFSLYTSNGFVGMWGELNSGTQNFLSAKKINDSRWHHIAAVNNGTNVNLYVDGIFIGNIPSGNAFATSSFPLRIGANNPASIGLVPHQGLFDDVRFWSTARTQAQIVASMNAQLTGSETGLVAYYDMNRNGQGAGLTVDNKCVATGAALNGTTVGTASTPIFALGVTQQKPGSGNAISFDGVDDVVEVQHIAALNFPADLTVETWIKIPSNALGGSIIEKWGGNNLAIGYPFTLRFNQSIHSVGFARYNGVSSVGINGISIVDDNKWHHVSATKNGSLLSLYIDGVLQGTITDFVDLSNVNNAQNLNIGYGGAPFTDHLLGSIDEVRVWNTALTQAQIRDRMCHKITSSDALYSNLVAYYNFDESTGNTVFDGTANANNGTLTNSPARVTSGAAIGNTSAHNYVTTGFPAANLSFNAQDNLAVTYTAGTFTGEAGTHVYAVSEIPNSVNGITGVGTNDRYFGVFNANLTAPVYSAVYNYNGNPFAIPNEPVLNLFKRTDNATTTWTNASGTLNTTANTLTATGQNTEYMLGAVVANYVFTGSGNWSVAGNWQLNNIPPNPLPSGFTITIAGTGVCNMDVNQTINSGSLISINNGHTLQILNTNGFTLNGSMLNNGTTNWTGSGTITLNGAGLNTITGTDGVLNINANEIVVATPINFTGTGAINLNAIRNILVQTPGSITVVNGNIDLKANQAGSATGDFVAIRLVTATLKTNGTGNIILNGKGLAHASATQRGVSFEVTSLIESTSATAGGNIQITGTGGNGALAGGNAQNIGVLVTSSTVKTLTGNISITGTGGGTDGLNAGIILGGSGIVSSIGSGTITLVGTGSVTGNATNYGVNLQGVGALISSTGGDINITGIGAGVSSGIGISIFSSAQIIASGTAKIIMNGTGSNGTTGNGGVQLSNANTLISSSGGNIEITGLGRGSSNFNRGITVFAAARITASGTAKIIMNGTGSATAVSGNDGITISNASTLINSTGGNIEMNGVGNGTGTTNSGITISDFANVTASATAKIIMNGTGAIAGTTDNYGVLMSAAGTVVSSSGADIEISGLGKGTAGNNVGLFVSGANLTASNNANMLLSGTGGGNTAGATFNNGVSISVNGALNIANGNVTITGIAGAGDAAGFRQSPGSFGKILSTGSGAINITATGSGTVADVEANNASNMIGGPSATGPITINANSYLGGPIKSTGALVIKPRTAGTTVGIGTGAGTLNFDNAEIAFLQDGFSSITIGNNTLGTGDAIINTATFTDPLTVAGGKISVTSLNTGSNNVTLNALTSNINDIADAATDITSSGIISLLHPNGALSPGNSPALFTIAGAFNHTGNMTIEIGGIAAGTQYDRVAVTGNAIVSGVLNATLINGFNPIAGEVFDIVTGASVTGTFTTTNIPAGWSVIYLADKVRLSAPSPTPVITAGGPTTFCAGGSVTLTSSSVSGNQWFLNTNSIAGATNQTFVATVSGDYTVVSGASPTSALVTVTANPLPATPTITAGSATTFCAGGSVTLTSSAATGNLWSNSATTASINVTASGIFTVATTDANGCTSASSLVTNVTVNPLPATPTITAGGATTFCAGGSVTLTSSAATGNLWSNGATSASIIVNANGSFAVATTDVNGCTSASSLATSVTVNPLPATPTITAGSATTFCAGGSVTLTSSAATGNLWSNSETTASINVNASGSFTVATTDANGCTSAASSSTSVTVNPLPTVTLASFANVCDNAGLQTLTGGLPIGGTYSGVGVSAGSFNPIVAGVGTQTISYLFTDANSCVNTATASLTVITCGGTFTYYADTDGDTFGDNANSITSSSPTPPTGFVVNNTDCNDGNAAINPNAIEICNNIDDDCDGSIDENLAPSISNAGTDILVCNSNTITLNGNTPLVGNGNWTIISSSGGVVAQNANPTSVFSGIYNRAYILRWTITNAGCPPSFDDVIVFFQNSSYIVPRPANISGITNGVCGTTQAYSSVPNITFATYTWSGFPTGTAINSQNGNIINVTYPSSGWNRVSIILTASQCGVNSLPRVVDVKASPNSYAIAGPSIVCPGTTGVVFSVAPPVGANVAHTWYVPAGTTIVSGQGTNSITVNWGNNAGNVVCSNGNSCGSGSGVKAISVTCRMSATLLNKAEVVNVYPNPSNGLFTIEFSDNDIKHTLEVTDLQGRIILSKDADNNLQEALNMTDFKSGMYLLKIVSEESSQTIRLIKE